MSRKTREIAAARVAAAKVEAEKRGRNRKLRNGLLGCVAVALLGLVGYGSHAYMSKPLDAASTAAWDIKKVYPTDISFGGRNAPVRVTEYGSLTCIHCKNFHENELEDFVSEYVDTGKVHFVFRHFPYDSAGLAAASFVSCLPSADRKDAVDVLMANQSSWVHASDAAVAAANLVEIEDQVKLSAVTCAKDGKMTEEVSRIGMEASQHGVSATPTFVVGDNVYGGFMGAAALGKLVEQQLSRVSGK